MTNLPALTIEYLKKMYAQKRIVLQYFKLTMQRYRYCSHYLKIIYKSETMENQFFII